MVRCHNVYVEELRPKMAAASIEYLGRKQRVLRPRGKVLGSGWWPSDLEKQTCCEKTPYPKGLNSWVKLKHCCTGVHVANLHKCDEREMKRLGRQIEKSGVILRRDHYTLLWQLRKHKSTVSLENLIEIIHLWERESSIENLMGMSGKTRQLAVELVRAGMEQADALASALALE
jgi:hypothetical protein